MFDGHPVRGYQAQDRVEADLAADGDDDEEGAPVREDDLHEHLACRRIRHRIARLPCHRAALSPSAPRQLVDAIEDLAVVLPEIRNLCRERGGLSLSQGAALGARPVLLGGLPLAVGHGLLEILPRLRQLALTRRETRPIRRANGLT